MFIGLQLSTAAAKRVSSKRLLPKSKIFIFPRLFQRTPGAERTQTKCECPKRSISEELRLCHLKLLPLNRSFNETNPPKPRNKVDRELNQILTNCEVDQFSGNTQLACLHSNVADVVVVATHSSNAFGCAIENGVPCGEDKFKERKAGDRELQETLNGVVLLCLFRKRDFTTCDSLE